MTENEIMQKFKDMQYVHASRALHEQIIATAGELSDKHKGFYFPLFAFQAALAGLVILLLVGLGSGVVLAAKGSNPGTPFYPVKQLFQKIAPQIVKEETVPTPTPFSTETSPTPYPSAGQHHSIQGGEREDEHEGESDQKLKEIVPTEEQKVEGAHTQNSPQQDHHEKDQGNVLQELFDR